MADTKDIDLDVDFLNESWDMDGIDESHLAQREDGELSDQLFFIFGPPVSGQKYWIQQEALVTDPRVDTVILPLELQSPQTTLVEVLSQLGKELDKSSKKFRHIYCELPWDTAYEDIVLEEWMNSRPELAIGSSSFLYYFLTLIPYDADRLPKVYREGLEEFARSSHSTVVIIRTQGDDHSPAWVNSDHLDLGDRLDIGEDELWTEAIETRLNPAAPLEEGPLKTLSLPVAFENESAYKDSFKAIVKQEFGNLWGAELSWKDEKGGVKNLTYTMGQLYQWESLHPSFVSACPVNGGIFHAVGAPMDIDKLKLVFKSQRKFS